MSFQQRLTQRRGVRNPEISKPYITTVVVVSATPPALETPLTHQLVVECRDATGSAWNDRIVTYVSADPSKATVSATGLVTAVAPGTSVITITCEGGTANTTYTITSPIAPVASVDLTPTAPSLVVGQTVDFAAVPRDAGGNVVVGEGVDSWLESDPSKTDVAILTSTSARVTAVAAGSPTIQARVNGIDSPARTITISAPTALVDALGILHHNCPADYDLISGRFYATNGRGTGNKGTRLNPYGINGAEGWDTSTNPANPFERFDVIDDATRPFQAAVNAAYGGTAFQIKAGRFTLNPGTIQGVAWAQAHPNSLNNAIYPVALRNKRFRHFWSRMVMKWPLNMPSIGPTGKCGFLDGAYENSVGGSLNFGINSPNILWAQSWANTLLDTTPLNNYRANLQGTPDNALTGTVNGVAWASGVHIWTYPMTRGVWYSVELLSTMSSTVGGGAAARDGTFKIIITPYDDATGLFGLSTTALDATGLEVWTNQAAPTGCRTFWSKIQRYFQFAGTTQTYNGPVTGPVIALDVFGGKE
jgi:hypothetical protein